MRGVVPFDEGALHEAILRRSGSGVRGSGSHPGSRKDLGHRPAGTTTGLRGASLDAEARARGKPASSSSPGSAVSGLKTPQWSADRRRAPRQVRAYELPKRRVGAPPPSLRGKERRTKGGPALNPTGRRSVGLNCYDACLSAVMRRGELTGSRPENCTSGWCGSRDHAPKSGFRISAWGTNWRAGNGGVACDVDPGQSAPRNALQI
jgi:hypothetical protein